MMKIVKMVALFIALNISTAMCATWVRVPPTDPNYGNRFNGNIMELWVEAEYDGFVVSLSKDNTTYYRFSMMNMSDAKTKAIYALLLAAYMNSQPVSILWSDLGGTYENILRAFLIKQ